MVSVSGATAAVYFYDYLNRRVDLASITLNATHQGSATTLYGGSAFVDVSQAAASGVIDGVSFYALRNSLTGPYSNAGYSGTITLNGVANNAVLGISPNGQAALFYFNFTTGALLTGGGIGTINSSNIVSIPTVAGLQATLTFAPSNGSLTGTMTLGSFQPTYFLIEGRRPRLVNISTRGSIGGGRSLIAGFVAVDGSKTFLIRGVGPTLASYGVTNANSDPVIKVYLGQALVATNDNWSTDVRAGEAPAVAIQVGAFPLASSSKDAAMVVTLDAGIYSVVVSSSAAEGEALVEVYEVN